VAVQVAPAAHWLLEVQVQELPEVLAPDSAVQVWLVGHEVLLLPQVQTPDTAPPDWTTDTHVLELLQVAPQAPQLEVSRSRSLHTEALAPVPQQ
jgi:hypothetical protein